MKFYNPHNGHSRTVGDGAYWWPLLFGPIYFLIRGAWPAFLVLLVIDGVIGVLAFPLVFVVNFIVAFFTRRIMKAHYLSRGYQLVDKAAA